jgi:hypothetical protein
VAAWSAWAARMAFLIGIAALSIGTLLLLTQAEEPKQDRKVIHLTEVTCKTFTRCPDAKAEPETSPDHASRPIPAGMTAWHTSLGGPH